MKNVRIWFSKTDECKYISHLDLNRCMLRAVRRAQLPIWYTEGFNPHPFVTFPLPISLGIDGMKECMDIRIIDDSYDISLIAEAMNKYLPTGIRVITATYPKHEPKLIAYAEYEASVDTDSYSCQQLRENIEALMTKEQVIIQKKSKAGMKDLDVLPYIKLIDFADTSDECKFSVVLPAGNTKNIGLPLILKAIEKELDIEINYRIKKTNMFTENMISFA